MSGEPLRELQAGLDTFREELLADDQARHRTHVAALTFGGATHLALDFTPGANFAPPKLTADGHTPMAAAILEGLQLLQTKKRMIRELGLPLYCPWVILISDGSPTDDAPLWTQAIEAVRQGGAATPRSFLFYTVAVRGAYVRKLAELPATMPPLPLSGLKFREFFQWLTASLGAVGRSQPGQNVALPPPTGWMIQS